ncbi:60S ribosomal protein L34 [Tulasnella sp. UAMH 9824]|nr:60S ribosomal protein L34 [Tulasnella sp. UAMH 9824]
MTQRVTLRKRQPYVTRGHTRRRIIRTPGGKYVYQHLKKLGTKPKLEQGLKEMMHQVLARRPKELQRIAHHHKTVSRAYGGSRCASCVRQRVMRAFLIEEAKIVKKVIKEQAKAQKKGGQ